MKRKPLSAVIVLLGIFLTLVLFRDHSPKHRFPDGSEIILTQLKISQTNIFEHGNLLSRSVGRFVPTNGLEIGKVKIERPTQVLKNAREGESDLTVEFKLLPSDPPEQDNWLKLRSANQTHRWQIYGEDGFIFTQPFRQFESQSDGEFSYLSASSFPRTSRVLNFRLEHRENEDSDVWSELTTFAVKNPAVTKAESWLVQERPIIQLAEDLTVEIGELLVRKRVVPAGFPPSIYPNEAVLPIQVRKNGQIQTNWEIEDDWTWDASGNYSRFLGRKGVTNDWIYFHSWRPLDPEHPWRFKLGLAMGSGFSNSNLFSFTLPPTPSPAPILTNWAGIQAQISKNSSSQNGTVGISLINAPNDTRLTYLSFELADGTEIRSGGGIWSQHDFSRLVGPSSQADGSGLRVNFAVHQQYWAEFILQPTFEANSQ